MSEQPPYNDWGRSTRTTPPTPVAPPSLLERDLAYERAARQRRWRDAHRATEHPVAGEQPQTAVHPDDIAADAREAEARRREVQEFNRRGLWLVGLPQYQ